MKLNNIIIYAVSGLFALSLFFFVVASAYTSVSTYTSGELQSRLVEFEQKAKEAAQKEESRKKWRSTGQIIDEFKKQYMLKIDEFSTFRHKLRSTLLKFRLRMFRKKKIGYSYKQLFPDIMRATVKFTVSGSYVDLKRFIYEINHKQYPDKMVILRRVELSKRKNEQDVTGEFAVEVYVAK